MEHRKILPFCLLATSCFSMVRVMIKTPFDFEESCARISKNKLYKYGPNDIVTP